jgi:hypothetical protein
VQKVKQINIVKVSLIVGGIIALCVMVLSITHAAAFFERSGYHGWFARAGVVAIELLFLYGSSLTLWLWLQGEPIPLATKVATGLGIIVNLYSNLTSGIAQDGKPITWTIWKLPVSEPIIAGVLITMIYIVAELVISDAIKASRKKQTADNQTDEETIEEISIKRTRPRPNNQTVFESNTSEAIEQQSTVQTSNTQSNNAQQRAEGKQTSNQTDKLPLVFETNQTPIKQTEIERVSHNQTTIEQQSNNRINPLLDEQTDTITQSNSRISHLLEDNQTDEVFEIIDRLIKQTGKRPSIRTLAIEANITNYQSGKKLKQYEQYKRAAGE